MKKLIDNLVHKEINGKCEYWAHDMIVVHGNKLPVEVVSHLRDRRLVNVIPNGIYGVVQLKYPTSDTLEVLVNNRFNTASFYAQTCASANLINTVFKANGIESDFKYSDFHHIPNTNMWVIRLY